MRFSQDQRPSPGLRASSSVISRGPAPTVSLDLVDKYELPAGTATFEATILDVNVVVTYLGLP